MSRRQARADIQSDRPSNARTVRLVTEPPVEEDQEIPRDKIEARAYEIWVERGRPDGTHLEDWLQAERELKTRYAAEPEPRPVPRATIRR